MRFVFKIEMQIETLRTNESEFPIIQGKLRLFRSKDPNAVLIKTIDTVLIPSIPSHTTPQDFLHLMGIYRNSLVNCSILQDEMKGRWLLLCRFKTHELAHEFYKNFNGRPFSSFETELCNIVWINEIQTTSADSSLLQGFAKISMESNDPRVEMIELPSCPVCLERMDSSATGLLTTLCHHTFHCSCIMKWSDTTCPVCRFNNTIQETQGSSVCTHEGCGSSENLWVCLICAHLGCGRYVRGHARHHFDQTGHVYSLEASTQRVWDYAGDGQDLAINLD